jgi:quercetin dioxygenase-like cupin family protein
MDVRRAPDEPIVEHGGTCSTFFMFHKETFRDESEGSYLEYISEFEIPAGERLEPHTHDTHEFYYMLTGNAMMDIEGEQQEVGPGDLIHIGRNEVHSIWPTGEQAMRALAFATSFMPRGHAGAVSAVGTSGH